MTAIKIILLITLFPIAFPCYLVGMLSAWLWINLYEGFRTVWLPHSNKNAKLLLEALEARIQRKAA